MKRFCLILAVALLIGLAGCNMGPDTSDQPSPTTPTPPGESSETGEPPSTPSSPTPDTTTPSTPEATPSPEATPPPTPDTRTPVPTRSSTQDESDPPEPRAVADNVSHEPGVDTIYRRTETLRGLTAREQVTVTTHGLSIVNPKTDERMRPGDPFDYPDDALNLDETQAKVLQFYSTEEVPLTGMAAAGMARGNTVNVANESAYERIARDSFDILLVHEFTHTLQNQNGLNTKGRLTPTTDEDMASLMLPEGDATLTAYNYWREYDAGGENPLALRNRTTGRGHWTLGFTDKARYYGALYLQTVPADRRDAHLVHPPDTTAEVMHPDGTWDLPGPAVTAPTPEGWEARQTNRVGELTIRYALRTNGIGFERAAAASTGWWNDSLHTFDRPEGVAASWSTRWANHSEATEFATTWRAMLENLGGTREEGLVRVPGTEHYPEMYYSVDVSGAVVHVSVAETAETARTVDTAAGAGSGR
jgi:hypothetical protein